jgi:hypothetical protein
LQTRAFVDLVDDYLVALTKGAFSAQELKHAIEAHPQSSSDPRGFKASLG